MASEDVVRKIRALLASDAHERQIAAAIVLGELGARDPAVVDALAAALEQGLPPVQRHVIEALGRIGARKALPRILATVGARDAGVRDAAVSAAVAFGQDAVAPVRERLRTASDPVELRGLEEILGRVGGKDAFTTLLAALDTHDVEAAKTAALAARQRIKDATPRERKGYLAQVMKGLDGGRRSAASPARTAASLKILGYLEDAAALPAVLAHAKDGKQPEPVRQEALIALRFVTPTGAAARVAGTLVELAESAPPSLARTALYTLASLQIPAPLARRLGTLAVRGEPDRAQLALERLAQMTAPEAGAQLATVLATTADRARAEAAATALAARPDAGRALATVLLQVQDDDARVLLLTRLLSPHAAALAAGGAAERKLVRAVLEAALDRAADGAPGAEALLGLARRLDGKSTAEGLRAQGAKLRKAGNPAALEVLRRLGRSADATPDDGYALASAELTAGRRDEALTILGQLLDGGFDVPAALRRDRTLEPEQRYQVGFQLLERRHPAGEEILEDLARDGGRGKVARMARAKLKSGGVAT
jgi:hypothetical protein